MSDHGHTTWYDSRISVFTPNLNGDHSSGRNKGIIPMFMLVY